MKTLQKVIELYTRIQDGQDPDAIDVVYDTFIETKISTIENDVETVLSTKTEKFSDVVEAGNLLDRRAAAEAERPWDFDGQMHFHGRYFEGKKTEPSAHETLFFSTDALETASVEVTPVISTRDTDLHCFITVNGFKFLAASKPDFGLVLTRFVGESGLGMLEELDGKMFWSTWRADTPLEDGEFEAYKIAQAHVPAELR